MNFWLRVPRMSRWGAYFALLLLALHFRDAGHERLFGLANYLAGMCLVWLMLPGRFWRFEHDEEEQKCS